MKKRTATYSAIIIILLVLMAITPSFLEWSVAVSEIYENAFMRVTKIHLSYDFILLLRALFFCFMYALFIFGALFIFIKPLANLLLKLSKKRFNWVMIAFDSIVAIGFLGVLVILLKLCWFVFLIFWNFLYQYIVTFIDKFDQLTLQNQLLVQIVGGFVGIVILYKVLLFVVNGILFLIGWGIDYVEWRVDEGYTKKKKSGKKKGNKK